MTDIIVIGAGTAGMTAALYALRNGKSVTVFEQETIGGQIASSPRVENFPTQQTLSGVELSDKLFEQITSHGAELELGKVTSVVKKAEGHFVVTSEYGEFESKAVILAGGVHHKKIRLPREDELVGNGISYCAVCDGAFYKDKDVALIGDGNTALQYSLLLSNYCRKVYVCTWFERFFGDMSLVKALKTRENVEWIPNCSLKGFIADEKLTGLHFGYREKEGGFDLNVEGCFIAIGQIPDNKAFSNLVDLDKDGYVVADETCTTKTPGFFVAGDCRTKKIRQLTTAAADGACAAVAAGNYIETLA